MRILSSLSVGAASLLLAVGIAWAGPQSASNDSGKQGETQRTTPTPSQQSLPPHPHDPLPPSPRSFDPKPVVTPRGYLPKDPGIGDGGSNSGGSPVEPPVPCPPGQTLMTTKDGHKVCAAAEPSSGDTSSSNARPIRKPDIHGCVPPERWDPVNEKCTTGVVVKPWEIRRAVRHARTAEFPPALRRTRFPRDPTIDARRLSKRK